MPFKMSSVFLFKEIYNLQFKKDPNSNLKINDTEIKNYNLNKCINENIKDINGRYLLLQVKSSLTTLIYQNIKLQNPFKEIRLYDGSPFVDDINKEYRIKKINEIQDDARLDKIIVLENLNQIHPFLFDLYNRNYIIKDEKKFIRICLENDNEQLTLVNDRFRIIILVDKKYVNKCELAFLNRLEKMILSFDKLLDKRLEPIANSLIEELRFKKIIKKYKKMNYSLKDLLINCGNEDIQGLIYYFSKESKNKNNEIDNEDEKEESIDENALKDKVIDRIYKILPQDIICILPKNNKIKIKYNDSKRIYNFREYIKQEYKDKEEDSRYKISIIYTSTSITNVIEGQNKSTRFMVSEIKSEDGLKNLIEDIQKKNKYNVLEKEYYICIHFQQSNSKNIKFISNFILNNFKDKKNDHYIYIFIIHINRNFSGKKDEKIYALPDINPSINQIFIDNLNGNNIRLNDLLTKNIKDILEEKKEDLKLDEEFIRALNNFISKELSDRDLNNDNNDYFNNIKNFIDENDSIQRKIEEIAYKLIDKDNDEETNCGEIIKKMYDDNYITKYTLDIASCLIDFIKENVYNEYLKKVFEILEDNNIFTTLYENIKNDFKDIKKNQIEEIIIKYLDNIEEKDSYDSKFLYNYNIPGLYNFYVKISNYINKNITINYFNNEKKLRELSKKDDDKIKEFYEKEDSLLSNILEEISKNHKFASDIITKIADKHELIFKDYITYYLGKYKNKDIYSKDDIYHKLIEILLKLRFNDEKTIIKNNKGNNYNILFIKIMWIESNINYILNILQIIDNAMIIFNNNKDNLLKKIEELIFKEKNIKYIVDEKKMQTKEVNECFYILLASICYCITSDDVKLTKNFKRRNDEIDIYYYSYKLTEINKILQKLNNELNISLIEMFIIDELIQIIEIFRKGMDISKVKDIKELLRENALIIQKYFNDTNYDSFKLSEELINNFKQFYEIIKKYGEKVGKDKIFYDSLRYIFFKEIKKISDDNYRNEVLEKILEENEMIKKSNDIFQILLDNYVKTDNKFKDNMNKILNGEDFIIKLIEEKLNGNNFILIETLLYFFEKNSLIYLKNVLNSKKVQINIEDEPLEILKECIQFLDNYILKQKFLDKKLKECSKLFCLGYIKVYVYMFIKMFNDEKPKCKNTKKIIDVFNGSIKIINDKEVKLVNINSISKMIRIYIYKVLYNSYKIDAFINQENIQKFKLEDYIDYNEMVESNELINIYKIDYKIKTLKDDYYEDSYKTFEKFKNADFKNKIKQDNFDIEEYGVDNFYVVSYNSILSNFQIDNSEGNSDFYKNICEPIFNSEKLLLLFKAISLFYNPEKYIDIKKNYNIFSKTIKPILFGYRFCLNELYYKKESGIYYPLYDSKNLSFLKDKLYPGNDTKFIKAYSDVINHFKSKPNEGCYVCLCNEKYYHSVPSGFPGKEQLNMKCPYCKKNVGSKKKDNDIIFIVKRDKYYRIFKDDEEINKIDKNIIKEINYMTLEKFKKEIYKSFNDEKGVYKGDKNNFLNDMKLVRNLSQISYRILNYILYVNLFFARMITDKKEFDQYLPKEMDWAETLNSCWFLIQKELADENILEIEEFMNYLFIELFPILNKEKNIDKYDKLINLETNLESKIQEIIKKYKEEGYKTDSNQKEKENDKASLINLLKEKYSKSDYKIEEYPFYEYFYYTDYLNEDYLNEKLNRMYKDKYPVLQRYLENKNKKDKNKYSLDHLYLFNNVLNLINEKYFNKISREFAEKNALKDTEIYIDNKDIIDKFIEFYNSLDDIKDKNKNNIKLSIDNKLGDFFIDENNSIGITYKDIYKNFINLQNEKLEPLLDIKVSKGLFDNNCKIKINIQQINERNIFTLELPKKVSIIDILFNSSYRKILDSYNLNSQSYKEYEINYDIIEENMTDLLLSNKKLFNEQITEYIYNNEVFSVQLTDLTTSFKERYACSDLSIYDKVSIYQFSEENKDNINLSKNMVNDFVTLLKYLNGKRKEKNKESEIKEEDKISALIDKDLKDSIKPEFIQMFKNNDGMTVNKISNIFNYYLKTIYEIIKSELDKYQEKLSDASIKEINNYYKKKDPISKKDIAYAIRIFATLVLSQEKDKKNKIQSNHNNLVNYLKVSELWTKDIYDNPDFNIKLNELKLWNVQINQTIPLYEYLGKDIENEFFEEVKKRIENEKASNITIKLEKEETNKTLEEKPDDEEDDDPFAKNEDDDEDEDDPYAKKDNSDNDD